MCSDAQFSPKREQHRPGGRLEKGHRLAQVNLQSISDIHDEVNNPEVNKDVMMHSGTLSPTSHWVLCRAGMAKRAH